MKITGVTVVPFETTIDHFATGVAQLSTKARAPSRRRSWTPPRSPWPWLASQERHRDRTRSAEGRRRGHGADV
jgi:hypothetical protein